MYKSINFFISIDKEKILGVLFNNASKGIADIGNIIYDKISLGFVDNSLDLYVLETKSMEELLNYYLSSQDIHLSYLSGP